MVTHWQVQALLSIREKVGAPLTDYRLRDDGQGTYIDYWDEATLGTRPAQQELDGITQAQIDAARSQSESNAHHATSRQKDILATIALGVRAKSIPAWNAMTLVQKREAVLSEAAVWVTIRGFI